MTEFLLRRKGDLIAVGLLLVLFLVPLFTSAPLHYLQSLAGENYVVSALSFIALMFLATVVAPIALPLAVPAAAPLLGAWQAAVCAVVGWTLGAALAFLLSRRYGRALIVRMVDLRKIERFESFIPERHLFLWMLFARLLLPVDVLSYALGLVAKVRFPSYMLATVLGITPFAFVFAYAGDALILREYGRVVGLMGLGVVLLTVGWVLLRAFQK